MCEQGPHGGRPPSPVACTPRGGDGCLSRLQPLHFGRGRRAAAGGEDHGGEDHGSLCGFGQRRETRPSVLSGFVRLRRGRDETRWRVCRSLHVPVVREPAPSPVWKRQISEKWCSLIKPDGL